MSELPTEYTFDQIEVGQTASFVRLFSEADVHTFAELSGDYNPLHVSAEYAETTKFGKQVVHGMLVASMISKLFGMYLPGKKCLFLKQNILFKSPVFIDDQLEIEGVVKRKIESMQTLEIQVIIKKNNTVVIEGEALVQVL